MGACTYTDKSFLHNFIRLTFFRQTALQFTINHIQLLTHRKQPHKLPKQIS